VVTPFAADPPACWSTRAYWLPAVSVTARSLTAARDLTSTTDTPWEQEADAVPLVPLAVE
jgi:hypothetical protein